MATLLLSAAGAAIGGGFGGTVLGLSGAVIGRAVGATIGRVIDQRLLGGGSKAVEHGRIDRFRLTGAGEGAPVGRLWGRMRISGHVIWASRFQEHVATSGGGKGTATPKTKTYSYSVSLAVALCEGVIGHVGRIWADGTEIDPSTLAIRLYRGTEDQLPDPRIEVVEGTGEAPAYRGLAYLVIEDLDLSPFGNRVPQFSFEVFRPAETADQTPDLSSALKGVAMIPGTGEYSLATTPVHYAKGLGENYSANVHSVGGRSDLDVSLDALKGELPVCGSVSLVVSWFGDDLRCGTCAIRPKVEDAAIDGTPMAWRAGGIGRTAAQTVAQLSGRPAYGGTPADGAVLEGIAALKARGQGVVFYPFILMDQLPGNMLPDPWSGAPEQPAFPWRGRITGAVAPGRPGTTDRTAAATAEVAGFFGVAAPGHFAVSGGVISYSGPPEWSYRRFILHYAHLCAAAGGVDAFCIGSEMRGVTQLRGAGDTFPGVAALKLLAADVRSILGPGVKIGYAADWSEYANYQTPEGDLRFPLDALWSDTNIDFVGVDNYLPLSDWRDGRTHADAAQGSIYNLDYLKGNVQGGELYDWYYASADHRNAQIRTPITDGAYGEPWVWRVKDFRSWWSYPHHERIGGVRAASPTAWVPQSKPIWFTEFGCPALDKGTNEPNKFIDPKSSESVLPAFSDGRRDDLIPMQYFRAVTEYWAEPLNNPVSPVYGGQMVDMARAHAWAWDARPFPAFPARLDLWSDGDNYRRGHWLNGRVTAQPLASVVAEVCEAAGVTDADVSGLFGLVRGYSVAETASGRAALQPLMLAYGFDAAERDGVLRFRMRGRQPNATIGPETLAIAEDVTGVERTRVSGSERAGRVRLSYVEAEGEYEARAVEAIDPASDVPGAAQSEMALTLVRSEAQRIAERWLAEASIAQETVRLALPPSQGAIGPGDVVALDGPGGRRTYRIDRSEAAGATLHEGVEVAEAAYSHSDESDERLILRPNTPPLPVMPLFLDLPLLTGEEVPHAPHVAATATPWPGDVAVWSSDQDAGYALNLTLSRRATVGLTESVLPAGEPGRIARGGQLQVRVKGGSLQSVSGDALLGGANVAAIGDGSPGGWEVIQFGTANLIAAEMYELHDLLRGQSGTEADPGTSHPAGSYFVLLDGAQAQVRLTLAERGLDRHFRIGPAGRPLSDASFTARIERFDGIGLRPFAPAHLRAARTAGGDLALGWIRRTRVGGDSWTAPDVPIGELTEAYHLRVIQGAAPVREVTLATPAWTYTAGQQVSDGVTVPFAIEVAQVSDVFGPGRYSRITING